ncbi:hypothetical protein LCGC14_2745640 [marine sediment metagenome]|uniref:Uncharacterized protein n=1 Tax=marine sediment metagenome TaxID=412755 RepID=A0A0F8Z347_9ZZZZ
MSEFDSSSDMIHFATTDATNLVFDGVDLTLPRRALFFRRLWFVVSAIPRYLISGSVEVP